MALTLVPLALLRVAGRWAARITDIYGWRDQALLVLAGSTAYALIAFGVSQVCDLSGAAVVSAGTAVACSGLVSITGLGLGILAAKGGWTSAWVRLPESVWPALVAAGATGAALVCLAASVGAIAILARWSAAVGLGQALGSGWADAVGVLLASVAYLPNMIMWVLAYVSGPGILIGGGATASVFSVTGGLLPTVPMLAAVPAEPGQFAPLLLLLVVSAGAVGAFVMRRHISLDLREELGMMIVSSTLVSLSVLLLAWLSGGSLGANRLSDLGPRPVVTALCVWGLTLVGSLLVPLVAAAARRRVPSS
jgi:hypothetical protein